jgi:exopolyphosphatase/guanosine-5'-triphosphate,3'-diphosphate pyrophosphatase
MELNGLPEVNRPLGEGAHPFVLPNGSSPAGNGERPPVPNSPHDYETVAVADFGSNSTRLVLLNVYPDGSFKLTDELREPLRLADHLDPEGNLTPAIVERTVETARVFVRFCASQNVSRMVAAATSAFREAGNGPEVAERVCRETGLRLDILSGDEEAYYGYMGVIRTLNTPRCAIVDVGGGSAEIVKVVDRRAAEMTSLPLGAITLTNAFLDRDRSSPEQLRRLEKYLNEQFRSLPWIGGERSGKDAGKPNKTKERNGKTGSDLPPLSPAKNAGGVLVGLGGTARNIGKIYKRQTGTPLDLLHGLTVPVEALSEIYAAIRGMSLAQRREVPGLSAERADIIVAGTAVITLLAKAVGATELVVSGRGLRDGLFFKHLLGGESEAALAEDPAMRSTRNLMRYYDVSQGHAAHVADLALSIFDGLAPVHGMGMPERRLLHLAALLHDVGIAVSYYNHGAHGFYLLTHTGIDGLTHRETAIVSYLVAFHAGEGSPLKRWPEFRALLEERDLESVHRLGTLLRLCESLDRSESGNVREVRCEISWDGSEVRFRPRVTPGGEFELRDVRDVLPDFERAFGVRVVMEERETV